MLHAIADGHREAVLVSRRVRTKSSPGERRKQRGQPDRGDVYCSRAGNRVSADVFIDCVFLRYFLVIEHYLTIKCVVLFCFLEFMVGCLAKNLDVTVMVCQKLL